MSSSDQVQISYLKQSAKGTIPLSPFTELVHNGGTFGAPISVERSGSIRGDAQRGQAVRTGVDPEGSVNLDFRAKVFDDLLEGFMRSSWSTAAAMSNTDIQADNAGSAFTTISGDFTTENITLGQWVYVNGFANADVNGWYKVTSIAAGTLGVNPAPPADTNTAANTITIEGSYIRNGTDEPYFAFQANYKDLTDKWRLISDCKINQMELTLAMRSILTGSFNFMGINNELKTAGSGDGTVTSAPSTDILNASDHVTGVFINGTKYDGCVSNFNMSADMGAGRRNGIGQVESCDIKLHSLAANGSMSVYLTDANWTDILQKYTDFTKISIAFGLKDADGNGFVIEFPQVALSNEPGNIPGPGEDVMLEFDFEAEPGDIGDGTLKTMQISRRIA